MKNVKVYKRKVVKMEGCYKEYSAELDNQAKDAVGAVRILLRQLGFDSVDASGLYKDGWPDIVAWPTGEELEWGMAIFVEVEKRVEWWTTGKFPYRSLHILERKNKYLEKSNITFGRPIYFVSVCKDLKRAVVVEGEQLKGRELSWENKTKEKFYDIPVKECVFVDL